MNWWSVNIEARDRAGSIDPNDSRVGAFARAVGRWHGVAAAGGDGYGARISVESADCASACLLALSNFDHAVREVEMPRWPVVRLEAMTEDELEEELNR